MSNLDIIGHKDIALHQDAEPFKLCFLAEEIQTAIRKRQPDIEFNDTVWIRINPSSVTSTGLFVYFDENLRIQVTY